MNYVMKESKKMDLKDIIEAEDKEDKEKVHKLAETFREIADLFDECIEDGKTEEEIETILAKVVIKYTKLKGEL